jgi:hypothetical protein
MSIMSSGVFLAPGPDGPVSTARFEMFREGLQECEARLVVERALADGAARARLGAALAERCGKMLEERKRARDLAMDLARGYGYGEGWRWFGASGWEQRTHDLFTCAGAVERALGKRS